MALQSASAKLALPNLLLRLLVKLKMSQLTRFSKARNLTTIKRWCWFVPISPKEARNSPKSRVWFALLVNKRMSADGRVAETKSTRIKPQSSMSLKRRDFEHPQNLKTRSRKQFEFNIIHSPFRRVKSSVQSCRLCLEKWTSLKKSDNKSYRSKFPTSMVRTISFQNEIAQTRNLWLQS